MEAQNSNRKWLIPVVTAGILVIGIITVLVWRNHRSTLKQTPHRQELEAKIKQARQTIANYNGGYVVMGRVVLDGPGDPLDVNAQMEILADGYFAGETKDLDRPIAFRLHGYAPLDVPLAGKKGDPVDLGTLHMTPLPASKLCNLAGHLSLDGRADLTTARVSLSVQNGPVNTPHNGTSPRSHWPAPIAAKVDSDGQISATGFSPIDYWCIVSAPGFVTQDFNISFAHSQTFDLGAIHLEKPKQIELTYVVSDEFPFNLTAKQTATIQGGSRWKSTPKIYGWDLEFTQKNNELLFNCSYSPCDLTDLGTGSLEDFASASNAGRGVDPRQLKVESGHVYLLNQEFWKHHVLFRVMIR